MNDLENRRRSERLRVGRQKLEAALDHIQTAQIEMSRATADLSSVRGYFPEWRHLSKLYDRIRVEWYRVHNKMKRPARGQTGELDREPNDRDHDVHATGCGQPGWRRGF